MSHDSKVIAGPRCWQILLAGAASMALIGCGHSQPPSVSLAAAAPAPSAANLEATEGRIAEDVLDAWSR